MPQSRATAATGKRTSTTNSVATVRLSRTVRLYTVWTARDQSPVKTSSNASRVSDRRRPAAGHDLEEPAHLEAGAADQGAVDVGQRRELAHVVGLDAAAVDDVALIGGVPAEPLPDPRPDVRVRLAGLRRSRVAP